MPTISGHAAARLHARGDPRVLRAHRRGQVQQHGRHRPAGVLRARGPQPPRAAGDGRARSAQGGDHQLSRGQVESSRRQQSRGPVRRHAQVPFPRALHRADDFMEDPPKKFFRLGPGREVRLRYAYFITCTGGRSRTPTAARSSSCAAPTTRRRAAATRPTAARSRRRCTGSRAEHAVDAEVRLYDPDARSQNLWDRFSSRSMRSDALMMTDWKVGPTWSLIHAVGCQSSAPETHRSRASAHGANAYFESTGHAQLTRRARDGRPCCPVSTR
jgi:hypothetical protein